ncbi:MAG: FAD-dependent oxidoreductase [Paracoccaceae bacterium]|nr:FAD-dependent oxidoreductase [Paracoccaceae bacterium]
MTRIVVVGAGQAGTSLVARMRGRGFEGGITLIGEEPVPPYQRPPLSKAYLLGEWPAERLYLRPEAYYGEQDIELLTGIRVMSIDPDTRTVIVDGDRLAYDELVLATGARPRDLPSGIGGGLDGVYPVRTLGDVDSMAQEFQAGARVLVIGGGYIGLEVAAVAVKRGLDVTVVEMTDRILQRVAAPQTSEAIRGLHRTRGVDVREGVGVAGLTGQGRVDGACLSDGSRIEVDFVIVGIGILPDIALADAAGLDIDNGIRTDSFGRTSVPGIWAAGDCASFPFEGRRIRLESVQNAIDQAEAVADNITGAEAPYQPVPWFWSDQYDLKLQIAGLNTGYSDVVTRREPGTDALRESHWYFCPDGRLLAVDAMNDPRAYMVAKRLIEAGKTPDPAVVADPSSNLKAMLR